MKKYILLMFLFIALHLSFSTAFAAKPKNSLTSQRYPEYYCVESGAMPGTDANGHITCTTDEQCVIGDRTGYCNTWQCPENMQKICWEHYEPKPKTK